MARFPTDALDDIARDLALGTVRKNPGKSEEELLKIALADINTFVGGQSGIVTFAPETVEGLRKSIPGWIKSEEAKKQ